MIIKSIKEFVKQRITTYRQKNIFSHVSSSLFTFISDSAAAQRHTQIFTLTRKSKDVFLKEKAKSFKFFAELSYFAVRVDL